MNYLLRRRPRWRLRPAKGSWARPARGLRRLPLAALVAVLSVGTGCGGPEYRRYDGATMGTYYRVTARCPEDVSALVSAELRAVNDEMSTYLPDSALSRFNRAPVGQWWDVPRPLAEVVAAAARLSRESAGAFDVTVGPLVNLWGFGPPDPAATRDLPGEQALARARQRVGFEKLEVRLEPPALRKTADLYVDLSAIAKGHGVDRVAERLLGVGCSDLLVDVGGEVRGVGRSPSGRTWRVGVETPDPGQLGGIERVVLLDDVAAATSGDYRNYVEVDGRRYSHTIDPRTGRPVDHRLASVTVLHASAMWADGYATALDVLGPEAGFDLAERLGLPALFIVRGDGSFHARYTDAFGAALAE